MNPKLLSLRLDRIRLEKNSLSVEDMLMLVTQDSPNLSSGFFSRLFNVSVPDKWQFYIDSSEEIDISLRFISLIEQVFIPHYSGYAKRYAWTEQCVLFKLKHQATVDFDAIVNQQLQQVVDSTNQQLSREILKLLFERAPSGLTHRTLAQAYKRGQFYTDAISLFERYFEEYSFDEGFYFEYLECLLLRKNTYYNKAIGTFSDVEYALHLVVSMEKAKDEQRRQAIGQRAVEMLLPPELLKSRGEDTNVLADVGRAINSFGKFIGKEMGGADADIPYSKGVIASAPKLLNNPEIVSYLDRHESAKAELEKVLKDKGATFTVGLAASAYSLGLIWNYAHIDSSVLSALTFASQGNPEGFSQLQHISEEALEKARAVTRLTGYVAEQQVAMNLQQQGHVVEMPTTANQAGYDLIVDGTPMQVKCSMDANYVLHHFDKYPDVPVIVNKELADKLGDHPMVFVDAGLSYSAVQDTTRESLEHLANFDSLGDALPIPLLTIAFAAYRNFGEFNAGRTDVQTYAENVGKEVATVAGGAMIGKFIGGTIGAIGGPVGIAIGSGLGAFLGGIAGTTGADRLNRAHIAKQRDVVVKLLIEFATWFRAELLEPRVAHYGEQLKDFKTYFIQADGQITVASQLFALQCEAYLRAYNLNQWIIAHLRGAEILNVQAGWVALEASQQFLSVELQQKVAVINRELVIYKKLTTPNGMSTKVAPQLKPS